MQTEAIFENIEERIQAEIRQAQKSIIIAVAWFTNCKTFKALLEQAYNGCTVQLIILNDEINENSSINYHQLNLNGSHVFKIGNGALMHNKFCVIDHSTVITGSYNWSYKAETNFENIVVTYNDTTLAGQYISEFNRIRKQIPHSEQPEKIFPLNKIIQRLEILKNYILLEDFEDLQSEAAKLELYNFNSDLNNIINDVKNKEFTTALRKIQHFITANQQLLKWTDPEIIALKLEIKNLETQLNAFDNEKIELEKLLSEFQHRHAYELGEIILEILKLRKLKFTTDKAKYKEAEQDEKEYRQQFEDEKEKKVFELNDIEKLEIKARFRKATVLCHPDKVSDEFKEAAQEIFIELKAAYDCNDHKKVSVILNKLENGNFFKARSETVSERDLLKAAIAELRRKIKLLEEEIIFIKQRETFETISSISNWDEYFKNTKKKLEEELYIMKDVNYEKLI